MWGERNRMWAKECCPGPLLVPQNRDVAGLGPFRVTQLWPWDLRPNTALEHVPHPCPES